MSCVTPILNISIRCIILNLICNNLNLRAKVELRDHQEKEETPAEE